MRRADQIKKLRVNVQLNEKKLMQSEEITSNLDYFGLELRLRANRKKQLA